MAKLDRGSFEKILFVCDLASKRIYFLSPHLNRNLATGGAEQIAELEAMAVVTKTQFVRCAALVGYDASQFQVMLYPFQYYDYNESNLSAKMELCLSLLFLEKDMPIWYPRTALPELKLSFCAWLMTGEFPC